MYPTAQIKLAQDEVDGIQRSLPDRLATAYIQARMTVLVGLHRWMQHAHVIEHGRADHLKELKDLWDLLEHVRKLIPYMIERAKTHPELWNSERPGSNDPRTIPDAVQSYVSRAPLFRLSVLLACNPRYRAAYDDARELMHRAISDHRRLLGFPRDETAIAIAKRTMHRACADFERLENLDSRSIAAIFPYTHPAAAPVHTHTPKVKRWTGLTFPEMRLLGSENTNTKIMLADASHPWHSGRRSTATVMATAAASAWSRIVRLVVRPDSAMP
ncbi:hypothetical protein PUNSTDRAFT_40844 [Punctularia strigosozonata HHB-11173 SS5]|uniref:uncharacterized protein n=1 Tax=Punctularia strigosozonata (strain HHB-11173) TaxID=741275 RepID=UPI000441815E|nr:uncharacterized protein PUNSTDRAFT_40844 [Punctularia strigosozonata HHB-11173 SS5]EIN13155.1 hypothetical protein PUNSTDRAFT_40844 [Punctularia strigosozonata HHB-11173 SS5]